MKFRSLLAATLLVSSPLLAHAQDDAPPAENPAPAAEAPAAEAPAEVPAEAPATPAAEAPATPAAEVPATPAVETPAETPAAETPAAETPATETPAAETPELAPGTTEAAPAQGIAANLVSEALAIATRTPGDEGARARVAAVRGAASLLPRLAPTARDVLVPRWISLAQNSGIARTQRLSGYAAFFEGAARGDANYARTIALGLPDAAARAGAFIDISETSGKTDYTLALSDVSLAQQAARREPDLLLRARALTFISYRLATLDPASREAAVREASSQVRLISTPRTRDYLLAEVVGATANFDLILARKIAADISDENLKNLAIARTNIAEISQTTLTVATQDRVAGLAKAAARYDVRAIPILIQLPSQPDVLKSLSGALPQIYPTARPAIDAQLLERMWNYTQKAEAGTERDELQSRLARLMVLEDLWRGRDWGKQLAWKGGRVQVGAFLNDVLAARRSQVRAAPLQDVAKANVNRAILQARALAPAARTEALLLIAGQILG